MTLERKKDDKGCVHDIRPEALGEEMKARFFVCLGFMRSAHLREEVGEDDSRKDLDVLARFKRSDGRPPLVGKGSLIRMCVMSASNIVV
jgi:hypothetical protein